MPKSDKRFTVKMVPFGTSTMPQTAIYNALHQDYSSEFVCADITKMSESECGEVAVKRLLKGNRGHYGCLEHAQLVIASGFFPHSVMQQARTHRLFSFDVQSFRYTGEDLTKGDIDIEKYFYVRPVGEYTNRQGKKYYHSPEARERHLNAAKRAVMEYRADYELGYAEEHLRDNLPACYRQHFTQSGNLRSWLHFIDIRHKPDAQWEIQIYAQMVAECVGEWVPEIWNWYEKTRLNKAVLAP